MKNLLQFLFLAFAISACVGDDFVDDEVDPILRIDNQVDTIAFGETYQLSATFLNNVGMEEAADLQWQSSQPSVISVDANGLLTAITSGSSEISCEVNYNDAVYSDAFTLVVGEETVISPSVRTGALKTTSSYLLQGDFTLEEVDNVLTLSFAENYRASTSLPGLYAYLTNNPSTINGAYEIGKVEVFSGSHSYELPSEVEINEYGYLLYFCKPFNVKVGDGEFEN